MKYNLSYLESRDIDWFFKYGDEYFHVASAGGVLPGIINDRDKLREMQYTVSLLPDLFGEDEIVVNNEFLHQLLKLNDQKAIDFYKETFVQMAQKGFVSMDRTKVEDIDDGMYHIVCRPPKRVQLTELNELLPIVSPERGRIEGMATEVELLDFFK